MWSRVGLTYSSRRIKIVHLDFVLMEYEDSYVGFRVPCFEVGFHPNHFNSIPGRSFEAFISSVTPFSLLRVLVYSVEHHTVKESMLPHVINNQGELLP